MFQKEKESINVREFQVDRLGKKLLINGVSKSTIEKQS